MARLLRNLALLLLCADYFVGLGSPAAAATTAAPSSRGCSAAPHTQPVPWLFASPRDSQTPGATDQLRSFEPAFDRLASSNSTLPCDTCRNLCLDEAPASDRPAESNPLAMSGRLIPLRN